MNIVHAQGGRITVVDMTGGAENLNIAGDTYMKKTFASQENFVTQENWVNKMRGFLTYCVIIKTI